MNLVNGVAGDVIGVRDRGFSYGDGVFRTFTLRGAKPAMWRRQYAKLAQDCRVLNIKCPHAETLERDLALIGAAEPDCVVKIIVTRGESARGYAAPVKATATRVVLSSPLPEFPAHYCEKGVQVRLCRMRLAAQAALAGVKHLNRLESVMARAEWSDANIAEGLMCDADDNLICGTMSNVFLIRGDRLLTPDLTRCGVSGVMRDLVLELAHSHKIPAQAAMIGIDDLLAADAAFLVNSVIGLWPVAALDRKTWSAGGLTVRFQQWIRDAQSH
jgi:4-amino-4-deoxychorismate lyase